MLRDYTLVVLIMCLLEYLRFLYCGCWFWAAMWLAGCAVTCHSLRVFEQQYQLQRALDEVDRVKRECLAFLLQLPCQIYLTCEIRNPRVMDQWT